MRVDKIGLGSIMHCVKRGGRGLAIVKDEEDCRRFIKSLYYLNDSFFDEHWDHLHPDISDSPTNLKISWTNQDNQDSREKFIRPEDWPDRNPIVGIVAYTLLYNHLHLILMEIVNSGVARFMKKLGQSMTNHFNVKNKSTGSLFQGGYRGKLIDNDSYLMWVVPYVMIKNTFEMHPKGLKWATDNFNDAWKWAIDYPYSSLGIYAEDRESKIIDTKPLKGLLGNSRDFKQICKEMILGRSARSMDVLTNSRKILLDDDFLVSSTNFKVSRTN
jgi:REP element-mobilizing transposase RayT